MLLSIFSLRDPNACNLHPSRCLRYHMAPVSRLPPLLLKFDLLTNKGCKIHRNRMEKNKEEKEKKNPTLCRWPNVTFRSAGESWTVVSVPITVYTFYISQSLVKVKIILRTGIWNSGFLSPFWWISWQLGWFTFKIIPIPDLAGVEYFVYNVLLQCSSGQTTVISLYSLIKLLISYHEVLTSSIHFSHFFLYQASNQNQGSFDGPRHFLENHRCYNK